MFYRYQAKYMLAVLLLVAFLLTLIWQLVNAVHANYQKHCQLILFEQQINLYTSQILNMTEIQEKNQNLINLYNALGQSIAALNIQLQVAQKYWFINPEQAHESLTDASQLSASLMYEVRQIVKEMSVEQVIGENSKCYASQAEIYLLSSKY
ncbi:histidine kinase dimerization/phosphoacceptor domain-containing protein [Calothrix sp. UHCC 0171]|uniref:histidine kinase dimerization/phosphoacceptor domain-containing protein n=1 Tax=Calothrix sp. UHCC 0171 TaxID=3110245 RepID=UPI002B1ED047|nr:histidine kinase dimerization/phosphoacceptor domain-containing protein [Calothrix sp. UHCC 0171]MEA5572858.1 histidine kinase dimerization/phosphoacceptor domain-containing protein [Calothrix sp. UHCC 0171]